MYSAWMFLPCTELSRQASSSFLGPAVFCHPKVTLACVFCLLLCTHFVEIIFRVLWVHHRVSLFLLFSAFSQLCSGISWQPGVQLISQHKEKCCGDYHIFDVVYINRAWAFYFILLALVIPCLHRPTLHSGVIRRSVLKPFSAWL